MKQIILLFMVLGSMTTLIAQSSLESGDNCFDKGDYVCAKMAYQEVMKKATGRDKIVAEVKYSRAKSCDEWLTIANSAFSNENYQVAKENYQFVLNENGNDAYAKTQLEKSEVVIKEATVQSSLSEGENCFEKGDYTCAKMKYQEAMNTATGRDKIVAEVKYSRAKSCDDWLKNANSAFTTGNYQVAKENYQFVLNENSNDVYAQKQLDKCETAIREAITLSVSKENLTFSSLGGKDRVFVSTNANSYSLSDIPSWFTVKKGDSSFDISYTANTGISDKSSVFRITAGDKEVEISVFQPAPPKKQEVTLSVSKQSLYFSAEKGEIRIDVNTNASNYEITSLPSWCRVKSKYSSSFIIEYATYPYSTYRSDWFKVTADDKEIKINVHQSAPTKSSPSTNSNSVTGKKRNRIKNRLRSFSSLGFQSGEIAKYGLLYETGGRKAIGFRVSLRTSQTPDQILDSQFIGTKTEMELGPNIKISQRLYLNLGGGYGYYKNIEFFDDQGYYNDGFNEDIGYIVGTAGLMLRLTPWLNINGGVSFQDVDKDFYDPEITFGISFNLRKKSKY